MKIKTVSIRFGDLRLALEEVSIPSHAVVGTVIAVVLAIFLWAVI